MKKIKTKINHTYFGGSDVTNVSLIQYSKKYIGKSISENLPNFEYLSHASDYDSKCMYVYICSCNFIT